MFYINSLTIIFTFDMPHIYAPVKPLGAKLSPSFFNHPDPFRFIGPPMLITFSVSATSVSPFRPSLFKARPPILTHPLSANATYNRHVRIVPGSLFKSIQMPPSLLCIIKKKYECCMIAWLNCPTRECTRARYFALSPVFW